MRAPGRRRLTAILALAATLAVLAWPAASMPSRMPSGDMCVGGKLVPAAPATVAHDCEACCASTPTALPSPGVAPVLVPFAHVVGGVPGTPASASARTHVAQARAPPVS